MVDLGDRPSGGPGPQDGSGPPDGEREAGVRRGSAVDPFDAVADYVRQRLADDAHVRATVLFGEA